MTEQQTLAPLRLTRLVLTQFRNYEALTWRSDARMIVLHGANGSGKTNFLEAISLLVPGRGLRAARIAELPRRPPPGVTPAKAAANPAWGVAGRFATLSGPADIATGSPPVANPSAANLSEGSAAAERRVFRLDGVAPRSQAELAARVCAVWLTPQMDRLLLEGPAARRRFLDRLVQALEPGHAREVAAFETALASRNRLLAEPAPDPAWLAAVEDSLARHAVAVTAGRRILVSRLDAILTAGWADPFPRARAALADGLGEWPPGRSALAAEDAMRTRLAASRARDAAAGGAEIGPHRADLLLSDAATGRPAAQASTGQQKALLTGVVLGHAALIAAARGAAPLLLLDEPAVHLDAERRRALFDALDRLPAQVFMTGTDPDVFAPLRGRASLWRVAGDRLHPDGA